jgi:hypothetical protein
MGRRTLPPMRRASSADLRSAFGSGFDVNRWR